MFAITVRYEGSFIEIAVADLVLSLGIITTRAFITALGITSLAWVVPPYVLASELPYSPGDFKTVDGHEYHGPVVTEKTATGITIRHASGAGRFAWSEIPAETQAAARLRPHRGSRRSAKSCRRTRTNTSESERSRWSAVASATKVGSLKVCDFSDR